MPWGMSGFGYREPAPTRLTLEELLAQAQAYQPTPRPAELRSIADLSPEDRKRARQQSLFAGLAAMGAAMQSGDWRNAGAGAQQVAGIQEDAVAQANARADQQWQEEQRAAIAKAENAKRSQQTAALYGMYQRAVEGEDPAGPFAQRAEAAARAGDMSKLETMAGPETKSMRAAARSKGYDPDAWDVNKRLQEELAAELDRQRRAATDPLDIAKAAAEAKARQEAETAGRVAQRDKGVLWQPRETPAEAGAIAAAQAAARAKYEQAKGEPTRIGQLRDGSWAEIYRSGPNGEPPRLVVIPGQPVVMGKLAHYRSAETGAEMVFNPDAPELGAVPMKEHEPGAADAPTVQDLRRASQPAAKRAGAGVPAVEQHAAARLSAVTDPGMKQKIATARAAGYSDAEIAAFLGIH